MPDALTVERELASADGQRLKALLSDRDWRLDNLYTIRSENGDKIKFVRNEAQRAYSAAAWSRDVIPKARKLGFSTNIAIEILDSCLFRGGTVAGIVDRSLDDAQDKLGMIRFAYENMPGRVGGDIRKARPLKKANESELVFRNDRGGDSSVTVGTSYRGGTPNLLHWSEAGKTSVDNPDHAREIMSGAIQAVPATGKIWVESTAHGTAGIFYDMVQRARAMATSGAPLTPLDWRLHFFGWWIKREYRLPNNLVVVPAELREYFEVLRVQHKLKIDADQAAWYVKKWEEIGPDEMKQEYPSIIDELFFNSILGAYWKAEINKARREGRIGQNVPYDPTRPVDTFWDIGLDCTAIGFRQSDGVRNRVIDYWEEEGASLQKACGIIHEKQRERGFVYGRHYGPHDLEHGEWGNQAVMRKATAAALGVVFTVIDRIPDKADSIEAARRLLNMTWIDQEFAGLFVTRCENYRRRWNKNLGVFMADPVHDINSHGADAFQQLAMGEKPDNRGGEGGGRRRPKKRGSAWAA